MDTFKVEGGLKLKGEITPQGAKNEALQIISAVLLSEEKITISNIPQIIDVILLIELLEGLGVAVEKISGDTYTFQANDINLTYCATPEYQSKAKKIRGSVMLIGPMLARFGKAYIPKPGGDKIGRRRLDTHFLGFEELGAKVRTMQIDNNVPDRPSIETGTNLQLPGRSHRPSPRELRHPDGARPCPSSHPGTLPGGLPM